MAFKKKENILFILLLIVTAITLPLVATQNTDCKGKAFHCVNSTHFKICVDLGGGVSTTVDDFLIQCPKSTVCKASNYFECEYHPTTTLKPIRLSEVTNDQISETPAFENFDSISTLNGGLISDIELSKVIISTTLIPEFSSTTLRTDSVNDPKNVTSVISDSATFNTINTAVTEVSSNLLSTTTEKVILDNNELNYTELLTGATLNTYLASDVTEGYTKKYIENKSTLLSNTLTNYIDKDDFNHTSVKNESFLVLNSENISVNKTTNIQSGVSITEIEPNSSTTKNIVKEFSTENVLRSSLYDEVAEQNTIASSRSILSSISEEQFSPFKNEIGVTTDRNINIHQEKLFTAAQSDIWKKNNTAESKLHENSFDALNIKNILQSTKKNTTRSKHEPSSTLSPIIKYFPTVKNILYHQNEYMPTKIETQDSFSKEKVVTDINGGYIDHLSKSTTESNSNYETERIREELNVSTPNVSETFNYSLSDLQLSMSTASNEYISFTSNPFQSTIYDEINNAYSLPSTISKSDTVITTSNNGTKSINYYNYTDQTIILTHTESISKTDGTETTPTTRDNFQTTTTISPAEFSNQPNSVLHSPLSTMYKPNNSNEFAADTFIELQATDGFYPTQSDENPHQSMSTISVTENKIQTVPVNITLPAVNVLYKINSAINATNYEVEINKNIKTTSVNDGKINSISALIDEPVTILINVSSMGEKTNTETHMYDSEKIPTTVTLVAGKYSSSTDSNITPNIEVLNNIEFKDMTLTADTTEPYVSTSEINDASLRKYKNTMFKNVEDMNIDKINTIITKEKHAADITVPNIPISEGNDVSMQIYNNINNQEKVDMDINKTIDINLLKLSSKMNSGEEITEIYIKNMQNSHKRIEMQNTTTLKVVDAIINNNNEKNIPTFNNTITLEEYISDEKIPDINTVRSTDVTRLEYNYNVNSSHQTNMHIFNTTNEIDENYVTNRRDLVVNDSINSNLNINSPITEQTLSDLNIENIYKATNNVKLDGEEIKIDTALSDVNSSKANTSQIYDSDDITQVNYTGIDDVIQTTDKNIHIYDDFKVKHDKPIGNTINVNFMNGTGINVHGDKNILTNEMKLKARITEPDVGSTEASVNSLTTETYYYNITEDVTFLANDTAIDVNIVDINDKTLPHMAYDVNLNIRADTNVHQNGTILEKKLEIALKIADSNNLKTHLINYTKFDNSSLDVNITIDNEDNIQTNKSTNKFDFFANSTVSDVITESLKIVMLNTNIDEVKEMKSIAGETIYDFNFTGGNNNRQTYNNSIAIQPNIADIIPDKNHTKNIDTMQMHYNIEPNVAKYNEFGLDKTKNNASVTKTLSKSLVDLNLEKYNNSDVNVIKDRAVDINFANSTNKGIQRANMTEYKEIKLITENINATAIYNINMPTYNNTEDSLINIQTVRDLSYTNDVNINTYVVTKTDDGKRLDITMDNFQKFNNTLANESIAESNNVHIQSDTPIDSSKFDQEHTILGFNVTKSNDVNLKTGTTSTTTTVDLYNIKSSATSQQIYNNTQMQGMIFVSDVRVSNKSKGNTKENTSQTYPKDIVNQDIKLGKLRSNQTSTINNNSKVPQISKLEASASFYPVIAKEIDTNSSEIAKNISNLRNPLDILNRGIEAVTLINSTEEASEDNKYLKMAPNNEKKQAIITNTEKSALNKSTYIVQNVNISSPTPFTCNVGSRGKYSDENDCNKFYICIGKLTPIIERCPGDTVFSEISKQCTKNLSHCIRNNEFRCLAEGRFIDVLSNNFYYICAKNSKGLVRYKLKCQEGYHLNTETIHCTLKPLSIENHSKNTSEKSTKEKFSIESDKTKESFTCEKEGLFEFPDDCRKYFHCTKKSKSEFRRKIKKCDSDEVFDKDKQECVDEDSHEEGKDDESNIHRIFKTNPSTPSSKIEPIEIIDYVKNIKVNEEASEDNKYLEMAPNNEKKQPIITNTEKSALNKSTYIVQNVNISSPTPFTCNVGSRGKYADENDCNKFYICIGKLTPIIGRCPGDTVFSEISKQCTKNLSHCIRNNEFRCLAEGRFIDVLSNNFYYICAKNSKGLVRYKLKCQEGYHLNTETIHCTLKPSSIENHSKNTSEKSTKEKLSIEGDKTNESFTCEKEGLFEFPDDCRKYFHCTKKSKSEFRRKIKKCDSDEVFDKDKQECVDEDSHEEVKGDESNIHRIFKTNTSKPSSEIEPIEIIDYVKNIKVNEEATEDNKYLEIAPNNEKKQPIITNTEKSDLSKPEYFVQHINISSPTPFTCNVRRRGKYSDKNDYNKFYICIGKLTPIVRRCPGDTIFSEISKQCTKNLSHCIRNNEFRCLAEGRFIDVLSNNFYYICAKNSKGLVRFKLKCQEGYRLNIDTVHCTLKPLSTENHSKNTSEKSTKEKLSIESDKTKESLTCEKEGLFEFPDDCRKYFHCIKKSKSEFRRKIKKCDSDEVFDKDKQECVDEDSHERN